MKIINYVGKNHNTGKAVIVAEFSVVMDDGLELRKMTLWEKEGRNWIGFPSEKYVSKKDGATKYAPYYGFKDKEAGDAFKEKILALLNGKAEPAAVNDDIPF